MKKLLAVLGVLIVIGAAFGVGFFLGQDEDADNPLSSLLNSSVNAAIDSSGVKNKVEDALYDNVDAIAKKTGIPSSKVKKMIDDLDVTSWEATSLPSDAEAKDSSTVDYNGTSAKITTYDDPSIVTIDSNGVPVTFKVPESAQGNLSYLKYM